jgi:hypothetical protein
MRALSTPQVSVNNVNIRIVPNSLRYDGGEGEVNVRAASGGGNNIESVHTSNAETKIGKVMFDVYLDTELDSFIAQWKEDIGVNSISFSERFNDGTAVTRSFDRMSLMNAVERNASADGVTSLEFEGDPMTIQ